METHFSDLRESNEFLNLLLDNMNSAVLIADENLDIHRFNDTFLQLFAKHEDLGLGGKFGDASGCSFAVEENKACGGTSRCGYCVLRRAVFQTMVEQIPVDKMRMERVFYLDGRPITKYLDISTRHITFKGRKMILVILYDVTEIETQKIELQEKQRQIDRDLQAAAGIQRSLLPQYLPQPDRLKIAWHFEPSRLIGGDIFSIHHVEEDRLELYILDVCGHGVSAAMVAVSVSQFLQSQRSVSGKHSEWLPPSAILDSLEDAFPFERFDTYFTMIYMSIDISRARLSYGSAGHPPPIMLGSDGRMEVLDLHGPAIGFGTGTSFREERKSLRRGDRVVLYTDGILEAHNPDGEIYGKERFHEALLACRESSAEEMVKEIHNRVTSFAQTSDFEDDISILVLELAGL